LSNPETDVQEGWKKTNQRSSKKQRNEKVRLIFTLKKHSKEEDNSNKLDFFNLQIKKET
jgi:hypothetical protein